MTRRKTPHRAKSIAEKSASEALGRLAALRVSEQADRDEHFAGLLRTTLLALDTDSLDSLFFELEGETLDSADTLRERLRQAVRDAEARREALIVLSVLVTAFSLDDADRAQRKADEVVDLALAWRERAGVAECDTTDVLALLLSEEPGARTAKRDELLDALGTKALLDKVLGDSSSL